MAQYTPKTWATGETITAAELNALEAAAAAAAVKADADAAYDAKGAATAAQAAAVQRANHTGAQSADTVIDGTTNKAYTAAEKTKLGGVAAGATANSTDVQLRDRSTHTGTQAASTITGLGAAVVADPAATAAFGRLVPTTTKTANYTAAVGDEAVMDLTSGPLIVTLPTTPANGAIVGVRALNATATNLLTVQRGGADTVGTTGATTTTLPLAGEATVFRYDAAVTRWLAVTNVKPLTALDSRYPLAATLGATVAADATVKAAFAAAPRGSRIIVLGDSTDAAAQGWYAYYTIGSKRVGSIRNAGVGGNTTTMMLARIQADVLAYSPDIVILGSTTNDQGTGIDPLVTRSNIATMVGQIRAIGATPILRTTLPADAVATTGPNTTAALRRQAVLTQNAWTRAYAASQGIDVLDVFQAVADPATGGYQAGISSDGVHPSESGYKAIADYLLALPLPVSFKGGFAFARAVTDDANMLVNGVFVGDANADGLADSWVFTGTGSCSLTAPTAGSGISGNWQRVTASSTAAAVIYQDIVATRSGAIMYSTGDTVEVVGRVRSSGTSAALVRIAPFGSAQAATDVVASTTMSITDGVFSGRITVPSDLTKIRVQIQASVAAGWTEVAEIGCRNLTRLGF